MATGIYDLRANALPHIRQRRPAVIMVQASTILQQTPCLPRKKADGSRLEKILDFKKQPESIKK